MDEDWLIIFKNFILSALFTTLLLKGEILIVKGPWWKEALVIFLIWYCLCVVIFLLDDWVLRDRDEF